LYSNLSNESTPLDFARNIVVSDHMLFIMLCFKCKETTYIVKHTIEN